MFTTITINDKPRDTTENSETLYFKQHKIL